MTRRKRPGRPEKGRDRTQKTHGRTMRPRCTPEGRALFAVEPPVRTAAARFSVWQRREGCARKDAPPARGASAGAGRKKASPRLLRLLFPEKGREKDGAARMSSGGDNPSAHAVPRAGLTGKKGPRAGASLQADAPCASFAPRLRITPRFRPRLHPPPVRASVCTQIFPPALRGGTDRRIMEKSACLCCFLYS